MPRDRFFVEGRHAVGDAVRLPADDAHKIADVLRMGGGDRIVVVDSAAQSFEAVIEANPRRGAVVARLESALAAAQVESSKTLVLAQAIPKGTKMDSIVEKATELGVARIIPLHTSRTIADASAHKLERWRKIARAAAQQSGRTHVPDVDEPLALQTLLGTLSGYALALFAWELGGVPLRDALRARGDAHSILAIVGPEGGFS
ncbi:MAG: 16S rRNA (uracil(1498)-N(3))-methyltransferase, partial [Candidatus Eremiobacteraeota bacterium]|nr:16S rRNA (uracil(1498)-N(3))-methyltransferase [Candidatus Eremiobacteraeota bacterium]